MFEKRPIIKGLNYVKSRPYLLRGQDWTSYLNHRGNNFVAELYKGKRHINTTSITKTPKSLFTLVNDREVTRDQIGFKVLEILP